MNKNETGLQMNLVCDFFLCCGLCFDCCSGCWVADCLASRCSLRSGSWIRFRFHENARERTLSAWWSYRKWPRPCWERRWVCSQTSLAQWHRTEPRRIRWERLERCRWIGRLALDIQRRCRSVFLAATGVASSASYTGPIRALRPSPRSLMKFWKCFDTFSSTLSLALRSRSIKSGD